MAVKFITNGNQVFTIDEKKELPKGFREATRKEAEGFFHKTDFKETAKKEKVSKATKSKPEEKSAE